MEVQIQIRQAPWMKIRIKKQNRMKPETEEQEVNLLKHREQEMTEAEIQSPERMKGMETAKIRIRPRMTASRRIRL